MGCDSKPHAGSALPVPQIIQCVLLAFGNREKNRPIVTTEDPRPGSAQVGAALGAFDLPFSMRASGLGWVGGRD